MVTVEQSYQYTSYSGFRGGSWIADYEDANHGDDTIYIAEYEQNVGWSKISSVFNVQMPPKPDGAGEVTSMKLRLTSSSTQGGGGVVNMRACLPRLYVHPEVKKYYIDDGHHRLGILKAMGVKKTPCIIAEFTEERNPNYIPSLIEGLGKFQESEEWKNCESEL